MAKTKYADVTSSLPRILNTDNVYQEKIDEEKRRIVASPNFKHSAVDLARQYVDLRAEKQKLDRVIYNVNLHLKAIEQIMANQFEAEETAAITLETGERVRTYQEPYAQITDKDALRAWCLANGLEREMAVPWMTIDKLTRERLLEGEPEPDGVTVFSYTKVRLDKA